MEKSAHGLVQWLFSLVRPRNLRSSRYGFTLIEMTIVMGIISVLLIATLASFTGSQRNARDSRRKIDLETLRQGLELYKSACGVYPNSTGSTESIGIKDALTGTSTCGGVTVGPFIAASIYPKDPVASQQYYYERPSINDYNLCARLEATGVGDTCNSASGVSASEDCYTTSGVQNVCNILTHE